MLDFDYLRSLLALIREYDVTECELLTNGSRILVKRSADATETAYAQPIGPSVTLAPWRSRIEEEGFERRWQDALELAVLHETGRLQLVKSPTVGIFHRSAGPSELPLVSLGNRVKKGQVICLIEAVRVINEIRSQSEGTLVTVYLDSAQPVQYGDLLFALKLD